MHYHHRTLLRHRHTENLMPYRLTLLCCILLTGCATKLAEPERRWLAGDHHIHSRFSVGWEQTDPPKPILGGDAIYSIPQNAEMARKFGLDWIVATDHGGPNHSRINLEQAYPELLASRKAFPDVIQFQGLELNTPGADHSSIIVPHTQDEAEHLHEYESRFDKLEPWPADPSRDDEALMLEALKFANSLPEKPVVIAHHPSRSAPALGEYGITSPAELRAWNDAAPEVAVGMEGAPGHQAAVFSKQGEKTNYPAWVFARGAYGRGYPTLGGFDQMTARLGGFWDSMLAEGRRWWITANSDSHIHYTEGGIDFWPGEYSKTYVHAIKEHADILDGIRNGRVFVVTGDLISELYVTVSQDSAAADIGGELEINPDLPVSVAIRIKDPVRPNAAGRQPAVTRVDLIVGELTGPASNPHQDTHQHVSVVERFTADNWVADGDYIVMRTQLKIKQGSYVRVRGTNRAAELEPAPDETGEDPWTDLWFYANPVFVSTR